MRRQSSQADPGGPPDVPNVGMGQGGRSVCGTSWGNGNRLRPPWGSGISQVGNGLTANKRQPRAKHLLYMLPRVSNPQKMWRMD